MPSIPFRTLYIRHADGLVSDDYVALLPKNLTLRKGYVTHREVGGLSTLFKQVSILPWEKSLSPNVWGLFQSRPYRGETRLDLLTGVIARLRQVVLDNWDSNKFHVVLHSSGLDSRMLSWIIRDCAAEYGDEWLGDVLFLCSKWEASSFIGIMCYEGWDDNQYAVVRGDVKNNRYYSRWLLDFDNAWLYCGALSGMPVNLFVYPIIWAQEEGLIAIDRKLQVFNSQWGNTILDYGSDAKNGAHKIRNVTKEFYLHVLSMRRKGRTCEPFADVELARLVTTSSIRLGHRLRPLLVEHLDARLATFTNMMSDGDRHRRIADDIIDEMVSVYTRSWYGTDICPDARPVHNTTEFQPFWSRWVSSSLCKHLYDAGHTIGY